MDLLLEQPPARTLVFVKSKRACDSLDDYLYNLKFPCTSIHGDRTQREREVYMNPESPILLPTFYFSSLSNLPLGVYLALPIPRSRSLP